MCQAVLKLKNLDSQREARDQRLAWYGALRTLKDNGYLRQIDLNVKQDAHLRTLGFIREDSMLRDLFLFACGHPEALWMRFLTHLGLLRVVYDLPESFVSLLQKIWRQSWLKGDARLFGKSGKRSFGACSATLALILILKLHEMWILCTGWLSRVGRKLTGKSPSGRRAQRHILPSQGKLGPNYSCGCCSGFWPFWPQ